MLADEPTDALDEKHANATFQLIKSLRDNYGKTVIIVTHNLDLTKQTDRIIELNY